MEVGAASGAGGGSEAASAALERLLRSLLAGTIAAIGDAVFLLVLAVLLSPPIILSHWQTARAVAMDFFFPPWEASTSVSILPCFDAWFVLAVQSNRTFLKWVDFTSQERGLASLISVFSLVFFFPVLCSVQFIMGF